jgi:serine/threonine protein kinase
MQRACLEMSLARRRQISCGRGPEQRMRVGPYEVISELGAGGMGRVRLARGTDGRLVVLKSCLRDDRDDDERLRDEGRLGRRLRHPGLVETVELLEHEDDSGRPRPVLVTAFVAGVSLLELRRLGPLSASLVCRLGRQLGGALDALHSLTDDHGEPLGVLHRDVTASNCLLGEDGDVRLIDLGIARSGESRAVRTQTGLVRGTLRYLAPEIFGGGTFSVQSDLWSLGIVLFEALVGRPAVAGNDVVAMGRICVGNVMELLPDETADARVLRALTQLLQKKPVERPRSAREAAALFAMYEKTLEKEQGRPSLEEARAVVRDARARGGEETGVHATIWQEETSDAPLMFTEPPFLWPPPPPPVAIAVEEDVAAPRATTSTPRSAADHLRDYAATWAAMEKQLHNVEIAQLSAEARERVWRASLQDTASWPSARPFVFDERTPVLEDHDGEPGPLALDIVAPAAAESPANQLSDAAPAKHPPTQASPISDVLQAFLQDEETPTPSLSPAKKRNALTTVAATTSTLRPWPLVYRAFLAVVLIVLGTVVALLATAVLQGWRTDRAGRTERTGRTEFTEFTEFAEVTERPEPSPCPTPSMPPGASTTTPTSPTRHLPNTDALQKPT